jgi:hypothetical protein
VEVAEIRFGSEANAMSQWVAAIRSRSEMAPGWR